ncbi:MAG: hypothetical protein ACJ77K_09305 [Bacteroidia bacterium]
MKDKIKAYYKISQAIHSSKNELHLKTCTVMVGVFRMRFDDASIEALLRDAITNKNQEILQKRFREARRLVC